MTRKQALETLLAKVESGQLPQPKYFRDAFDVPMQDMDYTVRPVLARAAYGGSLDAAWALHKGVLGDGYRDTPGFKACVWMNGDVRVWNVISDVGGIGSADDPARAWLIAIIKAIISEADT